MNTYDKKRLLLALALFSIVILTLGIPFTQWWFHGADDFHALWLAHKTKTWKQLLYFFYEGNCAQGQIGPTNYIVPSGRTDFMRTFYRPLYHILHTLQYWVFGTNAYPYFFASVTIHAVNTALLFFIFSLFTPLIPATLGSLMFAFHPQIAFRFGQMVNEHYYLNTCFILLCLLFYRKYVYDKKKRYLAAALFLYTLSLFTRETTIVLPAIVFLLTFALTRQKKTLERFSYTLKKTIPFAITSVSFLLLRLYLYPFKLHPNTTAQVSLLAKLKTKIPELKVFLFDFFALSWLPWNQPLLRGTILIFMISSLILLLAKNKHKLITISLLASSLFMLWPSLPGHYNPRYLYEAYGFVLAAQLLLLCKSSLQINKQINHAAAFIFLCTTATYGNFCYKNFSVQEEKQNIFHSAMNQLLATPGIKQRPLCFVGHPADGFGDHCAQFFWTTFNNPDHPVYFDRTTALVQADAHILKTSKYALSTAHLYTKNYLDIIPVSGGFRLTSRNPTKINFSDLTDNGYSLGKKTVHKIKNVNGHSLVTDFTLHIDKQYLKKNPIFIRWDYEKQKFLIFDQKLIEQIVQRL